MDSEIRIHVVLGTRDRARGSEAGKGRLQMEHLHRLVITVGSKGSAPLGRVQGPVPGSRVEGEEAGAFISRCRLSMRGCLPCVAWRVPVTRESHQVFLTEVLMTHVDGRDIAKGDTGRVSTACVLEDQGGKCHPRSCWGE